MFRIQTVVLSLVLLAQASCPAKIKIKPVHVSPENLRAAAQRLREGDVLMARREFYPALLKYLEAGKLNPNSEVIFNKIGIAYSQLSFHQEAIDALNRSIGLNDKYAYSYNNLGSVYFAMNNLKAAEKMFKKAISLKPDVATFHLNLGSVYFENKKFKKGIEEYRKALELDPEVFKRNEALNLKAPTADEANAARSFHLARLFAQLGDIQSAIAHLRAAAEHGFDVIKGVETEKDFDLIREDQRFKEFLEEVRLRKLLDRNQPRTSVNRTVPRIRW